MNDQEFAAFEAEIEELERECNTKELATKQLQAEGIVGEDGELAAPYRAIVCL